MPDAPVVDAELLLQRLRSNVRITVVDVRSRDDFRSSVGRIPEARSIPIDELCARRSELAGLESEPIVLVSRRGARAGVAVRLLAIVGFCDAYVLEGGMQSWLDLGLPVEIGTQSFSLRPVARRPDVAAWLHQRH